MNIVFSFVIIHFILEYLSVSVTNQLYTYISITILIYVYILPLDYFLI